MWLSAGQLSSERKVACLPVVWSHAEQSSGFAFMCTLSISYSSYLGCVQVKSFGCLSVVIPRTVLL